MDDLLKKTIISAVIGLIIYLAFFLFFDQTIDLWIYRNLTDTWIFQAGTNISSVAF